MTQEEKAKRYDELLLKLQKAKVDDNVCDEMYYRVIDNIVPELKESEDEKIRKWLIDTIKQVPNDSIEWETIDKSSVLAWLEKQHMQKQETNYPKFNFDDILAIQCCMETAEKVTEDKELYEMLKSLHSRLHDAYWLEKQGEQKQDPCNNCKDVMLNCHNFPCIKKKAFEQGKSVFDVINEEKVDNANKVEQKFKVGDWIVHNSSNTLYKIISFNSGYCSLIDIEGTYYNPCLCPNGYYHLWTIQDAKDGAVLHSSTYHLIWIYKDNEHFYACVNMNYVTENVATDGLIKIPSDACLATKLQRDVLFEKMHEAGYEWDAEKKKLKKIDQKSAWGEEDENLLKLSFENLTELKDRCGEEYGKVGDCISWLKSLKQRYNWKPSDEQMDALLYISRYYAPTETDKLGWESLQTLELMLSQLKELKGE